jgi:hypothetical protein
VAVGCIVRPMPPMKISRRYTNTRSDRTLGSLRVAIGSGVTSTRSARAGLGLPVDSVAEAFLLAKLLYGSPESPLVFTKRAEESAIQSPFWRPKEVFLYLEQLLVFASRLRDSKGALGKTYSEYFVSTGLGGYRHGVSQTALSRYANQYTTTHEGRVYRCDHHFTLGARCATTCLSIHFDTDPDSRRVIVTHCGRHLSNAKT